MFLATLNTNDSYNLSAVSWWREVRKVSGKQSVSRNRDEILKALRPSELHTESDKLDLANEINDTFLSPLTKFTTLSPTTIAICSPQ